MIAKTFADPEIAVLFFIGLLYLGLKLLELYDRVIAPALGSETGGSSGT